MARKNDTPQKAAMRELSDIDILDSTISRITDKNTTYRERMAGKAVRGGVRGGLP